MALKNNNTFPNFFEVSHPLIASKMALLRSVETDYKLFRELVHEITLLIAYEATHHLETSTVKITTPMEETSADILEGPAPVILPILRAGIGMVEAMLSLMPSAKVGHIGLFRNEETLEPENYYFKIPKSSPERHFYVVDPMMATGGSAIRAVETLKQNQVTNITMICILAVPEGLKRFFAAHPDVSVFSASLDRQLDENGFIRPGLGDAGDRMFGTF